MTNKPMLSVEREEIERAIKLASIFDDGSDGADAESSRSVVGILRAFLDKPVLESQYDGMTQDQAQAVSDGVDEILHGKPAAQHQGDTVERLKQVNNKQWRALIDMRDERDTLRALLEEHQFQYKPYDDHYHRESGYYCVGCVDEKGKHVDNTCHVFIALSAEKESVVAEQHAPIADHTQCEECKGWGYHENHHEGGGTECGECGGSGNAPVEQFSGDTVVCRRYQLEQSPGQNFYHYDLEPVYGSVPVTVSELITLAESTPPAVVMPEPYGLAMFKMLSGFDSVTPEQFNLVWTACRKEVARLNGVKP